MAELLTNDNSDENEPDEAGLRSDGTTTRPHENTPGAEVAGRRTSGFDVAPLEEDERAVLRALRAASEQRAERYLAVLAVLAEAQAVHAGPSFRAAEIVDLLPGWVDLADDIDGVLAQLEDWGAVSSSVDEEIRPVQRISDFYRLGKVWWLTPVGAAVHRAAREVLEAVGSAGGLRRRLLGDLRTDLAALRRAVDAHDAPAVSSLLRRVSDEVGDLESSTRDFAAKLASLSVATDLDASILEDLKGVLVEYLTAFSTDLERYRFSMAADVEALEGEADTLVDLAAAGDDTADALLEPVRLRSDLTRRWRGIAGWVCSQGRRRARLDDLDDGLTRATTRLLGQLRRAGEARTARTDRSADLVRLAAWFYGSSDAEAHRLFDTVFALGRTDHVHGEIAGPAAGPRPSWWAGPSFEARVSVRRRGADAGTGRTAVVTDTSATRARLAAEAAEEAQHRAEALAELRAGPVAGRELSRPALRVLLDALDEAWHVLVASDLVSFNVQVDDLGITVLADPGAETVLCCRDGELHLLGWRLDVREVV